MTAFSSLQNHQSSLKRSLRLLALFALVFSGLAQLPAVGSAGSASHSAGYSGDLHLASGTLVDFPSYRRACERQPERSDGDKHFPPATSSFAEAPSTFTLVIAAHFAALDARHHSLQYSPQAPRAPPLA